MVAPEVSTGGGQKSPDGTRRGDGERWKDKVGRRALERGKEEGVERLFGFTFDDDGSRSGPNVDEGQNPRSLQQRKVGGRGKRREGQSPQFGDRCHCVAGTEKERNQKREREEGGQKRGQERAKPMDEGPVGSTVRSVNSGDGLCCEPACSTPGGRTTYSTLLSTCQGKKRGKEFEFEPVAWVSRDKYALHGL